MTYIITDEDGRVYRDKAGNRVAELECTDGGALVGIPGDELTDEEAAALALGQAGREAAASKARRRPAEDKGGA